MKRCKQNVFKINYSETKQLKLKNFFLKKKQLMPWTMIWTTNLEMRRPNSINYLMKGLISKKRLNVEKQNLKKINLSSLIRTLRSKRFRIWLKNKKGLLKSKRKNLNKQERRTKRKRKRTEITTKRMFRWRLRWITSKSISIIRTTSNLWNSECLTNW